MNNRFQSIGRLVAGAVLFALAIAMLAGLALAAPQGKGKGTAAAAQYQYGPAGKAYGTAKIVICHKGKTIRIAAPAWKGHKRHGDTPGPCP
jgi:hypothetical protein